MHVLESELQNLTFYFEARRWEEGLYLTQTLLQEYPDEGRIWEFSGLICRELNCFQGALHAFETANTLIPLSVKAQIALADCYIHSEKQELALEIFKYLSQKNGIPLSLLALVKSRLLLLYKPEAKKCEVVSIIENSEISAEQHYNLAFYMGNTGYPVKIIEQEIKKAIQLAPDHLEYRVGLAGFLSQIDRAKDGYPYVAQLTLEYISELICECCLKRLVNVFMAANDQQKVTSCLNRLREIKSEKRKESLSQDGH